MLLLVSVMMSSVCVLRAQETCPSSSSSCQYTNIGLTPTTNHLPTQHYYIGGMFSIHERASDAYSCQSAPIRDRGILNMEAFHWAIKEFGSGQDVSVGGVSMDSCSRVEQVIENVLSFETCKVRFGDLNAVSPRNLLAYVGPDRSAETMAVSVLLKDMNKTEVTHAATAPELSNKDKYPFLLRSVPSDNYDATIIAELLKKLNVRYVQGVYLGNSYGRGGFMALKARLDDVCMVYETEMPVDATADQLENIADELLQRKQTRFVIMYTDAPNARKMMSAIQQRNSIDVQNLVFIGTSSWGDSTVVTDNLPINAYTVTLSNPSTLASDVAKFYQYLNTLKPSQNTWNPWFRTYWNDKLQCATRICSEASDSLNGRYNPDVYIPYTIIAVRAIIEGVKAAAIEACGVNDLCSILLNQENRGQRIYGAIAGRSYFTAGELSNIHVSYQIKHFNWNTSYALVRYPFIVNRPTFTYVMFNHLALKSSVFSLPTLMA